MPQESSKNNVALIIIAIIGVIGTAIGAVITMMGNINIERIRQETELTRIALESIATQGGATQISMASTISAPTSVPVFINNISLPTYTPYPTYTQGIIPMIQTPTSTPEANLLYQDNFENGVSTAYWQVYGTWMNSGKNLVFIEGSKFNNQTFINGRGVLIFPGTASWDNIAVEFDAMSWIDVLLSFKDENNYKEFFVSGGDTTGQVLAFNFNSDGNTTSIPQSAYIQFPGNKNNIHVRIEIRSNSLVAYINQQLVYDFKNLPDVVTGSVGLAVGTGSPQLLGFKVYQLP